MKNSEQSQTFYKSNIRQIKVNKRAHNNNLKNNSPSLSHQENNYFYNTKINRLILQEAPNNNRIQNIYQQPGPYNKNVYIEYDFLANNPNFINQENKQIQTLYKKNDSFKKVPVAIKKSHKKEINDLYYKKDSNSNLNGFNYVNNSINNSNNLSQNTKGYYEMNNNFFYNRYHVNEINNINSISFNRSNDISNNDNSIISQKNKHYFYNIDNNTNYYNNSSLGKTQIEKNNNNKSANCKKIQIKKEQIRNYYIRNFELQEPTWMNASVINSRKNIKYRYKSPEMIINGTKEKNLNLSFIQNDDNNNDNNDINDENNFNIGYKSGDSFYKKKEDIINNKDNNNKLHIMHKNNTSDNLKKKTKKFLPRNEYEININQNKVLNPISLLNDIHTKLNSSKNSEIREEFLYKIKNINLNENKINNINNFKNYIKNKLIDYNSMKKSIEDFCEILEQFYLVSFKKSYKYFIENLKAFNKNKTFNRSIILRRFNEAKKTKNFNNQNITNNSIDNTSNEIKFKTNERIKTINIENNIIKNNDEQRNISPLRLIEFQNNLMNSMMKVDQDNYIKVFNDVFNRNNENKRTCSPFLEKSEKNNSIKSLDLEKEKVYDKYNTNTNINICFQKKKY